MRSGVTDGSAYMTHKPQFKVAKRYGVPSNSNVDFDFIIVLKVTLGTKNNMNARILFKKWC